MFKLSAENYVHVMFNAQFKQITNCDVCGGQIAL